MIKDHNLDDLIIDDIKPANNKGKGILTILALLIVLLIVAIVMTRVFLGESDQNTTVLEQKQEDMISPELKLDATGLDHEADKKELDQLSSMMEETLVNKPADALKDLSLPTTDQADQIKPETAQVDDTAQLDTASTPSEPTAVEPAKEDAIAQEAIQDTPQPAVETQQPTVKTPEITEEPARKPVTKVESNRPVSSSAYYIQVGSFSRQPSKQFLSVISKSGFQYKLDKGKLLIGPYSNDADARKDLPNVRNKINKSAFIKHL